MLLSWFREPAYKTFRVVGYPLLIGTFSAGFFWIGAWGITILVASLWMILSTISVFNIRSGFYIPVILQGKTEKNEVFLSFDDGPAEKTGEILQILKKYKACATFFCIGKRIEESPEMLKIILADGHTIGNHSYRHTNTFPLLSPGKIHRDIEKTQELIKKYTNNTSKFFRPPFGITNPLIARGLKNHKLKNIGWSIRSLDTVKPAKTVLKRIENKIVPGSIILLHDTAPDILEILEQLLVICTEKGFSLQALTENNI